MEKLIFTLNPSQVDVEYKSHDIYFTTETGENVKYTWRDDYGGIHPLDKDDIIHLNDNRVKSGNIMKGTSKLESLQPAINNIRSAYIKRGINLTMPPGIFSNKDKNEFGQAVPLVKEEKEKAQKQLRTRGPVPIFTNMNINYSALDVSSRKMGLFDETIESTGRLCDAFGVPYKLLASKEAGTLNSGGNDVKESRKQMYEDTIIPDAQEKLDAINQFIQAEKTGWKVVATWDHLPIFASDIKEIATTNKVNVDGINTILNMVISDEAKVFLFLYLLFRPLIYLFCHFQVFFCAFYCVVFRGLCWCCSVLIMSTHPKPMAFFSPSPASYANLSSWGAAWICRFMRLHRR